jgi:hypothetical protein
MTTTFMLRVASAISFLFTLAHSLGGLRQWSPTADNDVLRTMTGTRFPMMGVNRSYLDLYLGLGWSISVFMLLQTVLLWQLATLARTNVAQVRPMIAAFALATLATCLIAWRLIFTVPAVFSAALLLTLTAASWTARGAVRPD